MTRALELGELANFTSVNVAGNTVTFDTALTNDSTTVGGNTALTLRTYSDTKAATAYSNATSYADTKAATAYSNATSYADTKAAAAYSNVFNGGTFTGVVTMQANLTANTVRLNGSMQIDGDLIVSGNTVTMNVSSLAVEDNMIYLNSSSNVANPDIGIAGNYNDGTYRHTGVFRDATDGVWKFFHQYVPEPDASAYIDTANNTFALANVQANTFIGAHSGDVTGNITGNTANLSTSVTVGSNALTVGSSLYVIANGNIGISNSTPAHKVTVQGAVGDGVPLMNFLANSVSGASFQYITQAYASGLSSQNFIHMFGQSAATRNAGYIGYKYSSNASANNIITLGHFGADNLLNLDSYGNLSTGTVLPKVIGTHSAYTTAWQSMQHYGANDAVLSVGGGTGAGRLQMYSGYNVDTNLRSWALESYNSNLTVGVLSNTNSLATKVLFYANGDVLIGNSAINYSSSAPRLQIHPYGGTTSRVDSLMIQHDGQNSLTISHFGQTHANNACTNQIGVWNNEQHLSLVTDTEANLAAGNSTKGIFLRSGGNVGIGTKSPGAKLTVSSSTPTGSFGGVPAGTDILIDSGSANSFITFRQTPDAGTYSGLIFEDNNIGGYLTFGTAGGAGDKLYLGGYGGVEIGVGTANTTAPRTSYLSVSTSALTTPVPVVYVSNTHNSGVAWDDACWMGRYSAHVPAGTYPTFSSATGEAFGFHATKTSDGCFFGLISRGANYNDYNTVIAWGDDGPEDILQFRFYSTTVATMYTGGAFTINGSLTQNASDRRLKENIQPIPNALQKVKALSGVTFDWKDGVEDLDFKPDVKTNEIGVIAQDVNEVLPQAVKPAPFDVDQNTQESKSGENYLTVQYEKLVPLLIEAVKELTAKVEVLEAKN